jgi:hypothetical protein
MIGSSRIGSQSKRSFFLPEIYSLDCSGAITVPIDRDDSIVCKLLREKTYGEEETSNRISPTVVVARG